MNSQLCEATTCTRHRKTNGKSTISLQQHSYIRFGFRSSTGKFFNPIFFSIFNLSLFVFCLWNVCILSSILNSISFELAAMVYGIQCYFNEIENEFNSTWVSYSGEEKCVKIIHFCFASNGKNDSFYFISKFRLSKLVRCKISIVGHARNGEATEFIGKKKSVWMKRVVKRSKLTSNENDSLAAKWNCIFWGWSHYILNQLKWSEILFS